MAATSLEMTTKMHEIQAKIIVCLNVFSSLLYTLHYIFNNNTLRNQLKSTVVFCNRLSQSEALTNWLSTIVDHRPTTRADTKSISNKTKEDNSKSKKARVVILVRDTSSQPFYISTKYMYHKNIPKGIRLTEQTWNQCIITVKCNKGKITPKVK